MRSSLLVVSTLALGALARPHQNQHLHKRVLVTETEVEVVTVIVTVTSGPDQALSASSCFSTSAAPPQAPKPSVVPTPSAVKPSSASIRPSTSESPKPTSKSSSRAAPAPSSSPKPSPKPSAAPEPKPQPSSSSQATSAAQPSAPSPNHPKGTDQAFLSTGPDYQAAVLYHHNAARANHNASPLTWDTACEQNALIAAQKCTFEHFIPQGAGQGQNLFVVSGKAFNVTAGITESWYKGELEPMMPYFGQNDIPDSVFHSVGHLTQLVWKGTTKVGCVSVDCGDKMIVGGQKSPMNKYTVCNYAPAGNVGGGYAKNVAAPISKTNLGGWAD